MRRYCKILWYILKRMQLRMQNLASMTFSTKRLPLDIQWSGSGGKAADVAKFKKEYLSNLKIRNFDHSQIKYKILSSRTTSFIWKI